MPEDFCLESVTCRIPPDVLAAVERQAAAERRSVSNLLRNVVEDWARRQPQHAREAR